MTNHEKYREYADIVPAEVKDAIEGLAGKKDRKYAVVMLLIDEGPLTFSEIESKLELHPQQVTNALEDLTYAGLVAKRVPAEGDISDKQTQQYRVTDFAEMIFDGLYKATRKKYEEPGVQSKVFTSEDLEKEMSREVEKSKS